MVKLTLQCRQTTIKGMPQSYTKCNAHLSDCKAGTPQGPKKGSTKARPHWLY